MRESPALRHANASNATIGSTYRMTKNIPKHLKIKRKFNNHRVFYKKVYIICNRCDLKSFNLLFI